MGATGPGGAAACGPGPGSRRPPWWPAPGRFRVKHPGGRQCLRSGGEAPPGVPPLHVSHETLPRRQDAIAPGTIYRGADPDGDDVSRETLRRPGARSLGAAPTTVNVTGPGSSVERDARGTFHVKQSCGSAPGAGEELRRPSPPDVSRETPEPHQPPLPPISFRIDSLAGPGAVLAPKLTAMREQLSVKHLLH